MLAGATTDVLWDWDIATGRVERNDALSTTFGYPASEVEPTREWWNARVHADDRARIEAIIAAALEREAAFAIEYRFRRADGRYATILDRAWIMRDAGGHAVRAVGSCVDISDRNALEVELRRKTERLATMMEMQRELATVATDFDGALRRVAHRAAQLVAADGAAIARIEGDELTFSASFGLAMLPDGSRLPIGAPPAADLVAAAEPLVVWDLERDCRVAFPGGAGAVRSFIAVRLVAESRPVGVLLVHGSTPRLFESEAIQALAVVAGMIGVAIANAERFVENQRLLAERTAALAAVRESEERYRTITDGTPLRIAVIDADQRYQFVNRTICQVHNKRVDEILGRRMSEIISPVNYERIQPYVLGALAGREQRFDIEWDIPGEAPRTLTTRYVPKRDEAGVVTGFYVISSDETEHRRLQEQVQRTQRIEAVGLLAGGIAHDFNNLLTVISGFAQMLALDHRLADDQRGDVDEIVKAVRRASELTQRLLAFGRKQRMEPELLNLNSIIQDNDRMLRRLVREDIELVCDLERSLGAVFADPRQIEQVLINLVVNARDAILRAGRITIETRNVVLPAPEAADLAAGPWVRLRVSDTGTGDDAASTGARVRAVFYDQADGRRHWARLGDGVRHSRAIWRRHPGCEHPRGGDDVHHLPAPGDSVEWSF